MRWADAVKAQGDESSSPLWLVADEPLVNDLVVYLDEMRRQIAASPNRQHTFTFHRTRLHEVRLAFARMIRHGEERLHRFCALTNESYLDGRYALQSVAIGSVDTTHARFTIAQDISTSDLYSQTDLDLGTRQLRRLRYYDGNRWSRASLVANFVEYQPEAINAWRVYKVISRIKAEEQIWNKVVDAIFGLDRLVRLDKQLRHLNRFVKDVFGVKIVVADQGSVRALHESLLSQSWSRSTLERHSVPVRLNTMKPECIETKDYLDPRGKKASGWSAMKSVFAWWDTMIEVQVQPLRNFHQERERLTRESHAGFKSRREALRNQIAVTVPLFGFYRDLLKWLFVSPDAPPPLFPSVTIVLKD